MVRGYTFHALFVFPTGAHSGYGPTWNACGRMTDDGVVGEVETGEGREVAGERYSREPVVIVRPWERKAA